MKTKTTTTLVIFLLFLVFSIELLLQTQKPRNQISSSNSNEFNPFNRLHIVYNPKNDTLTRIPKFFPIIPPSTTNKSSPSLSKDVTINPNHNIRVRIFLPRNKPGRPGKIPILVFVHGGGFILLSAGSPVFHEFASNAASRLNALVVSVEYRLAPESRLPAAYDDVLEALKWVRDGKNEWVKKHGDFKRCVIMGESAGGNVVYHVGLKVADDVDGFKPLTVKGLILVQPFFGGVERTQSEIRLVNDEALPLVANDLLWDLSLPLGSDRDHEYCDPFKEGGSGLLGRIKELGWRVGVVGCDGDPLYDRIVKVAELMEERGVSVKSMFDRGGYHGIFVTNFTKMFELFEFSKEFFL